MPKPHDITVTKIIPATPQKVFDLWLNTKKKGWMWECAECVILDPVVDGIFYFSMKHQGKVWAHYGRFTKAQRSRLLEHTWMSEATKGWETTVQIKFEPKGKGTKVTIKHKGVPDDKMGRGHKDGWMSILQNLEKQFAGK